MCSFGISWLAENWQSGWDQFYQHFLIFMSLQEVWRFQIVGLGFFLSTEHLRGTEITN